MRVICDNILDKVMLGMKNKYKYLKNAYFSVGAVVFYPMVKKVMSFGTTHNTES